MPAISTEGVILRKQYLRETSYILTVYTKDHGKIRGVVKGARDPYPQFAGNFEVFTKVQIVFYKKKKGMDLITRCEALDFFLPIRKEIERLTYANYFIELVDVASKEYDINSGLYNILIEALELLATEASPRRVSRIFEIKFLGSLGFSPQFDNCVECSAEGAGQKLFFSVIGGGIVCARCGAKNRNLFPVSAGTVNFVKKISSTPFSRTARIKVSKEVGIEIEKVLKGFMQYHIGREIKSLKFLGEMEKKGVFER